jgi:hypothetical protein
VIRMMLRFATIVVLGLVLVACGAPAADPVEDGIQVDDPAPLPDSSDESDAETQAELAPEPTEAMVLLDYDPLEVELSGGLTDEFPFPATDDAFNFENLLGLYSFVTYYDMDELILLYSVAIPTLGYSPVSDTVIPDMAILSFEGDGQVLTLNISTSEDGTNKVSFLVGVLQ